MTEPSWTTIHTAAGNVPALINNVKSMKFRVFNRVVATKPLDQLFTLLGYEYEVDGDSGGDESEDEKSPKGQIFLSSVRTPEVFGVRIGLRAEDARYVLAIDGSVEYSWREPVEYQRDTLSKFVEFDAAPRVTIGTWAVLAELAHSVGASLHEMMVLSPAMVVQGVMSQFDSETPSTERDVSKD